MGRLEKLCKNARCVRLRRGEAILCSICKGGDYHMPMLENGGVCVATTFYSTGHSNPEVDVNPEKIKSCPYRN